MKSRILMLVLVAVAVVGCDNPRKKAIEQIGKDEEILRKAGAAVNEVIRNSPDCEVARPLIDEAYQRIDEARSQVRAPASQQTLDALKAQVDRVGQACP
jgi:hypothetical protein